MKENTPQNNVSYLNTNIEPQENIPSPNTVIPPKKPKKRLFIGLGLALVIAVAVAAFVMLRSDEPVVKDQEIKPKLSLSTLPKQTELQFSSENFTAGYIKYEPAKLQKVKTTLPELKPVLSNSNPADRKQVLFMQDLASDPKALVMYDFEDRSTYRIAESNGAGSYHSPAIMSDHFVVFAETTFSDPVTSNTKIVVTNLETGKSETLMESKSSETPASLCCSVSPDGLRLVVPQTDKFSIYQVNEGGVESVDFPAPVKIFPEVEGEDNDDYAASQRNYGYPEVIWIDNDQLMYAKSHPNSFTVDNDGTHFERAVNGLAILNLTTGEAQDIPRTDDAAIQWFTVDGSALIYSIINPDLNGLTVYKVDDYNDSDAQPLPLAKDDDYQSSILFDAASKKLYIQTVADTDRLGAVQQLDVTTGKVKDQGILGFDFPDLEGVIGPNRLIINDSEGLTNDYYIYNVSDDTSEHLFLFEETN